MTTDTSKAVDGEIVNGNGKSKKIAKRDGAPPPAVTEGDAMVAMIERLARDPSVDISRLEKMLDLRRQEADRAARTEFLRALARLQADLPAVERKGTGHNEKRYARFEDFIEVVKPELAKHGFSLSFRVAQADTRITVCGVLGHEAGHQEATELSLPADTTGNKNAVQALGSSISYGKRYVGMTLLGVATEDEDDDGKKAGAGETIDEKQATTIKNMIKGSKSSEDKFCVYMSQIVGTEVSKIEDIPAAKFQAAVDALEAKMRAQL